MVQNPDASDPLLEISSLLPLTLDGLKGIGDLQRSFEALAARSSVDLSDQASSVLKASSTSPHGYKDRDVPPRDNTRPQERRPGLGHNRKRPRFSLKPAASQSAVGGGMSFDIDKLQDPNEFFQAYDKYERAAKEIKRQTGEDVTDLTQYKSSRVVRGRRPGIPGYERKSNYQQRFVSAISAIDEKLDPSQESLSGLGSPIRSNNTFKTMSRDNYEASQDKNGASQEQELVVSAAEKKSKVDSLFDQLLSEDCTDLDGDGAVKFLQKNLELGRINMDKLQLAQVKSVRKTEDRVSLGQSKSAKALSDIKNVAKRIIGKRQSEVGSTYSADSATPPRSSSSLVPMSSRYVLEFDRPGNLFSFPGIDDILPVNDSIHVEEGRGQDVVPVHVDSAYEKADLYATKPSFSDKFVSNSKEKLPSASSAVSDKMLTESSAQMVDHIDDCSSKSGDLFNFDLYERDAGFEDKVNEVQQLELVDRESISTHSNMDLDKQVPGLANSPDPLNDNITKSSEHRNPNIHRYEGGLEEKHKDTQQQKALVPEKNPAHTDMTLVELVPVDPSHSVAIMENNLHVFQEQVNYGPDGPDIGPEDKVEEPQIVSPEGVELRCKGLTPASLYTSASQMDVYCPIDEDHQKEGNSENAITHSALHNKVPLERSKEPLNLRSKQRAVPIGSDRSKASNRTSIAARILYSGDSVNVRRKQKPTTYLREREISRRKSLIGAGTLWEHGVRRSTRMKMKPLEYWRGERLLYARVHDSLVTVVGCKCISPTKKNGSPELKVRSFVSDDYKDIVDKVADMESKRTLSIKRRRM